MSWVAHDIEPYVIQKHLGRRVAIVPLLLGSYAPDMATKWFVYGAGLFGISLKADNPAQFHRGFPGVGFTHSLMFGVAVALLIYAFWRSRIWALSFLVGQWAHALTDTLDTVGTMLFFPFTTHLFSAGAWAYAGQTGRYIDAGAYFSGLGFVWDGVWLVWGVVSWRVLTRAYFRETIVPADPFWRKASGFLPETALLAIYRISFFYGACRWVAWLIWAHVVRSFAFDLSWGGPRWVAAVRTGDLNAASCPCPSCSSASPKLALSLAVTVAGRVSKARDLDLRRPPDALRRVAGRVRTTAVSLRGRSRGRAPCPRSPG